MSTYHWRCDCGAWGHSTNPTVNELLVEHHRSKGHVVEIWLRGQRHLATTGGSYAQLERVRR